MKWYWTVLIVLAVIYLDDAIGITDRLPRF